MILAEGVGVRLGGRRIIDAVDLVAATGQVTAVVGPNGSGKSTLLRALIRAVRLTAGTVSVDGVDIRGCSTRWLAQRVAFVGQQAGGDPSLTVAEEASLGGLVRSRTLIGASRRLSEAVADALSALDLHTRAQKRLGTLSGGELQRVALARALVQGADHVLLDEPTNHLDPRHRLEVLSLLRTIAPTAVVVLHDLDLAARFADHVIVMRQGTIAAAGPPGQVLVPDVLDPVYGARSHVVPAPHGLPTAARHFAFTLTHTPALERTKS